ncbi:hypothetical protein A3L10_08850 [Thermococcus radiotolerans]|uniref:NAD(P)-binding domain-containing protein n=2 Tax=Thermococcus radiotolerans TaxID=187880 RepID=A0A2Z2N4B6_9EURY|nr:hypothetical protein A3L10_08850 [Thermococcus radiotolerans]
MKVLITGGLGFIGRYLAFHLLESGYEVQIIDNIHRWNFNEIERYYNNDDSARFLKEATSIGDITNENLMSQLIKNTDLVIHLAAISRVNEANNNPELTFDYNVKGTSIVAILCNKFHKPMIFASSREVYGNALRLPVSTSHPLNPANIYGASKVWGEFIIKQLGMKNNLKYIIFRIANVYGPGDKDRVIPIFIQNALSNEPLIIKGKSKILDFVYINDIVSAFDQAIKRFDNINGYTLNLGSGNGTSLIRLAQLIVRLTNSNSNIVIQENSPTNEVERFYADITETKKALGWNPKVSLIKGLRTTIQYYHRGVQK